MSQRRNISVFNMSFLDLITNYLGATTILLLVAMKHYEETPCPNISRKIEAHYDPRTQRIWSDSLYTAVRGVKARDTILVIVHDEQPLPCGPQQSGSGQGGGNGGGGQGPRPDVCLIFPKIENPQCDLKNGTYTAQLVVEKSGACNGLSWKTADGITGRYGQPVTVGPFPLHDGDREIVVTDSRNSEANGRATIYAPNCNDQPVAARIIIAEQGKRCDNAGTLSDPSDDKFTVELKPEAIGFNGSAWSSGGKTGRYGAAVLFGPYLISQGKQKIRVVDSQNPSVFNDYEVEPTAVCSAPPPPLPPPPTLPGDINFYISWGDKNEKVDLYVQRDNRWVYDEHRHDPSIGRWDNMKAGPFDRTDCETIRQDKPLPGTYKVFAHYKGHREGTNKANLKVSLWVVSKTKPAGNKKIELAVPLTRQNPKRGGGKLLATVEVAVDGSIRIR